MFFFSASVGASALSNRCKMSVLGSGLLPFKASDIKNMYYISSHMIYMACFHFILLNGPFRHNIAFLWGSEFRLYVTLQGVMNNMLTPLAKKEKTHTQ